MTGASTPYDYSRPQESRKHSLFVASHLSNDPSSHDWFEAYYMVVLARRAGCGGR